MIDFKSVLPSNKLLPKLVTELGILIDGSLEQPLNDVADIFVIELTLSNITDVRLIQPVKDRSNIFFTVFGILIDDKLVHPAKQPKPIKVKVLTLLNVTEFNLVQLLKAVFPSDLTVFGILTVNKAEQPKHIYSFMSCRFGIVIDDKLVQK
jgi:hypothetical protein